MPNAIALPCHCISPYVGYFPVSVVSRVQSLGCVGGGFIAD